MEAATQGDHRVTQQEADEIWQKAQAPFRALIEKANLTAQSETVMQRVYRSFHLAVAQTNEAHKDLPDFTEQDRRVMHTQRFKTAAAQMTKAVDEALANDHVVDDKERAALLKDFADKIYSIGGQQSAKNLGLHADQFVDHREWKDAIQQLQGSVMVEGPLNEGNHAAPRAKPEGVLQSVKSALAGLSPVETVMMSLPVIGVPLVGLTHALHITGKDTPSR